MSGCGDAWYALCNLLFSVEHWKSEYKVVLRWFRVRTRVFNHFYKLLELQALVSIWEAGDLTWTRSHCHLLLLCWLLGTPRCRWHRIRWSDNSSSSCRFVVVVVVVLSSHFLRLIATSRGGPLIRASGLKVGRSTTIYEVHISCVVAIATTTSRVVGPAACPLVAHASPHIIRKVIVRANTKLLHSTTIIIVFVALCSSIWVAFGRALLCDSRGIADACRCLLWLALFRIESAWSRDTACHAIRGLTSSHAILVAHCARTL